MTRFDRRRFLAAIAGLGVGNSIFARALAAQAEAAAATLTPAVTPAVTESMIDQAAWIAGVDLSSDERALMVDGVQDLVTDFETLRGVSLDNSVAPAVVFDADPAGAAPASTRVVAGAAVAPSEPEGFLDYAFADLATLGALLRDGSISAQQLTRFALRRLEAFDPLLECVISLTEERALEQAARVDRDLLKGRDRGPLMGIPWGAKDLFAVRGTYTTWGATPYRKQRISRTATVVRRLDEAGAAMVAKLTLGALAWGDVWFDGTTKNPWNPEQGSSGSSAGSASAVAGGLVPFALGTETLGSIVSPSTRCGTTGLRPTFGRVSRHGAMALSWTMDKVGPIARSVDDCALVFATICGQDGHDPTAVDRPFAWPYPGDPFAIRVGYVAALFDEDRAADIEDESRAETVRAWQRHDRAVLETLRRIGFRLVPITLPDDLPIGALRFILTAEAAAAFDDLTRSGRDDELVRQVARAWPNAFRQGQMIPAVEYLRANRVRTEVMRAMKTVFETVDVYLTPTFAGDNLLRTNLTGHPQVVLPNGFRDDGTPTSITFTGDLFGEDALLAVAHAYQQATDYHRRRPPATVGAPPA